MYASVVALKFMGMKFSSIVLKIIMFLQNILV